MVGNKSGTNIKRNQDDDRPPSEVSNDVRVQIRCHHRAKNVIYRNARSYELLTKPLTHQRIFFSSSIGVLPQHPYVFLNTSIFLDAAQRRLKLTPEVLWMIDWEKYKSIQKQVRDRDYVIVQKMMWHYNPSQTVKNLYDNKTSTECELCGDTDLPDHFMICGGLQNTQQGKNLFAILKAEISKLDISPIFWDIIRQALHVGTVLVPEGTPPEIKIQLRILLSNQSRIGWKNFVLGRIALQWEKIAFIRNDSVTCASIFPESGDRYSNT